MIDTIEICESFEDGSAIKYFHFKHGNYNVVVFNTEGQISKQETVSEENFYARIRMAVDMRDE